MKSCPWPRHSIHASTVRDLGRIITDKPKAMSGHLLFFVATVLATHSAGNPDARLLTVEEAVGESVRSVKPEKVSLYWDSGSNLTRKEPAGAKTWTLPESDDPRISYGGTVSRNEFGFESGVIPSPDGSRLLVYRNDETAVGRYPIPETSPWTGGTYEIRYPMAGTASERLSLCVCDTLGNILGELRIDDFDEERYLTNPCWGPDGKNIFVQVLDRAQHNMRLNMYRASDGSFVRTILTEHNDAWVEPLDPAYFLKGSYDFIYRTDNRHGYRNLYLCDTLGLISRVTPCNADVKYLDNDGKYVYYSSAEISPIENHLFRVRINRRKAGKPQRLTFEEGWHEIDLSPDCTKFIDRYSSFNVPGVTVVKSSSDGRTLNKILTAIDPLDEYAQCKVELGSVRSADGRFNNYYRLYYPRDFDPSRKYPLIVYVYGGPHSQMVKNSWLGGIRMWEMLMAQQGYVVYVQDNRGSENRGAAFEKAINRRCGQAEAADQMEGIRTLLAKSPWIDRDRIGIHGWSYGGFMTISMATGNPGFFKVAVAGGPVIDWSWYEVMYGERYMDTPEDNPEGYRATSLLSKAGELRGRLLICQGAEDDVVVWRNAAGFIQKCIEEEKQVDMFVYPKEKHNMKGRARVHLYEKITDYFNTYL